MHLIMESRALIILLLFLQLSSSSSFPARSKRHVDGRFISDFSKARGSAAIHKLINSALAGKRNVREDSQDDILGQDSQTVTYNNQPEIRSLEEQLAEEEATEGQLCSAIQYLLNRMPFHLLPPCSSQDCPVKSAIVREEKHR